MKLSIKQKRVIKLMQNGYDLGFNQVLGYSCWVQKGGVGAGGQTEKVHMNVFNSIYTKKLIYQHKYGFPTSVYKLTELGKNIKL